MSGFDLVPVGGGDPVHLPLGESVLGRGPFLGVSDKRVSRNHGLLENLNGRLRLKPTHVNPCFIQSSPSATPQPLQRDLWYPLQDGDLFSLLPGQLIYKVVAVGGDDATPRNSQMFKEEELLVSPIPDLKPTPPPPPSPPVGDERAKTPPPNKPVAAAPSQPGEAGRSFNKKDSASPEDGKAVQCVATPPAQKRRVLPAWMMAVAAGSSSSLKVQPSVKGSKRPAVSSKRASAKRTSPEKEEEEAVGKEEEEAIEEEMPKKRRKKTQDEEEAAPSQTNVSTERPTARLQGAQQRQSSRPELSDESEGFTMEVDEEERKTESASSSSITKTTTQRLEVSQSENEDRKSRNGHHATKRAEAVGSDNGCAPASAASKPQHRTPCPYGKDCYRKNPLHFQECSHPGDTDYEEEEEEEEETQEADRPECPYGTDCYRKNPLHRKEYKHTQKPAYRTRKVPKKARDDDDEDDEDSGDDDSFINDDSEDMGDDSDYAPPDSEDSGKEDVKRLQKEAKVFLRRGK